MKYKSILWIIVLLILSSVSLASIDLTDGLISYYNLDETTGTIAVDSLNNNNGTASNARIFTSELDGIINTGADFTQGNDYINLNNGFAGGRTASLWFNPNNDIDNTLSTTQALIFKWQQGNDDNFGIYFSEWEPDTGVLVFQRNVGSTNNYAILSNSDSWNGNTWYNVIVVIDEVDGMMMYINGVKQTDTDSSTEPFQQGTGTDAYLGTWGSSNERNFDGLIDEVAIWDRALSSDEVELLHDIQKDGFDTGQYPFPLTINWDDKSPANDSTFTSLSSINFEFNLTSGIAQSINCTLYENNTILQEWNGLNLSEEYMFMVYKPWLYQASLDYYISCDSNLTSVNSSIKTIHYDIDNKGLIPLEPTYGLPFFINTTLSTTTTNPSTCTDLTSHGSICNIEYTIQINEDANVSNHTFFAYSGNSTYTEYDFEILSGTRAGKFTENTTSLGYHKSTEITGEISWDFSDVLNSSIILLNENLTEITRESFTTESLIQHTFTGLSDGTYYLTGVIYDTSENKVELPNYGPIYLDNAPPTTQLIVTGGTEGSNDWYTSDITFELDCSDDISGCYETLYCIDDEDSCTPNLEYTSEVTISTEGNNYVRFMSEDNVDNIEEIQSESFKLDKTDPDINYTENILPEGGLSQSWISSEIEVSDNMVGTISTITLYDESETMIDSDTVYNESIHFYNFTGLNEGTYYIDAIVYDYAGNSNTLDKLYYVLDVTLPDINIFYPDITQDIILRNNTAFDWDIEILDANVFAFEINCTLDGVTKYYDYYVDINTTNYTYTNTTMLTTPGLYDCTVTASDDHTDNNFKVSPTKKVEKDKITGTINDLKYNIKKQNLDLEVDLIKKHDRVSFKFDINKKGSKQRSKQLTVIPFEVECPPPFKAYKRNSNDKYIEHWVCSDGIGGYWIDGNTKEKDVSVTSYFDKKTHTIKYEFITSLDSFTMESIGGLNVNNVSFEMLVEHWEFTNFSAYNRWDSSSINNFSVRVINSEGTNTYTTTNGSLTINLPNENNNILQTAPTYPYGSLSTIHTIGTSTKSYNTSFWQSELTIRTIEAVLGTIIPNTDITVNSSGYSNQTTSTSGIKTFYINDGAFNISAYTPDTNFLNQTVYSSGSITNGEKKTVDLSFQRVYNVNIRRETTNEPFNFTESPTSQVEISLKILCQDTVLNYVLTNNSFTLNDVNCDWSVSNAPSTGWFFVVTYPESEVDYYRFINPEPDITNITVWLLEPQSGDLVVEHELSVTDLANNYDDGFIFIQTDIPGLGYQTIIYQKLDMQKKINAFLKRNSEYRYYAVDKFGNIHEIGSFIADLAESTIVLPSIPIGVNDTLVRDNIVTSYTVTDGVLYVDIESLDGTNIIDFSYVLSSYNIHTGRTIEEAIEFGEYSLTTVLNYTGTPASSYSLNYTLNPNLYYISELIYAQSYNPLKYMRELRVINLPYDVTFPGFDLLSSDIKLTIATMTTLGILMIGTVISMKIILLVTLMVAGIFLNYGWFAPINILTNISGFNAIAIILMLIAVLGIYSFMKNSRKYQ